MRSNEAFVTAAVISVGTVGLIGGLVYIEKDRQDERERQEKELVDNFGTVSCDPKDQYTVPYGGQNFVKLNTSNEKVLPGGTRTCRVQGTDEFKIIDKSGTIFIAKLPSSK